jgi:hypothetical protein
MTPCSLVGDYQYFVETCRLQFQGRFFHTIFQEVALNGAYVVPIIEIRLCALLLLLMVR